MGMMVYSLLWVIRISIINRIISNNLGHLKRKNAPSPQA